MVDAPHCIALAVTAFHERLSVPLDLDQLEAIQVGTEDIISSTAFKQRQIPCFIGCSWVGIVANSILEIHIRAHPSLAKPSATEVRRRSLRVRY